MTQPLLNAFVDGALVRRAATAIADRCFTHVYGEKAQRLVLVDDDPKRDWGGYCYESFEKSVRNELAKVLLEHMTGGSEQ